MMSPRIMRRVGAVLAAICVGLVGLELAVDRWFPVGGVVYRLDDRLLHDARPGAARIQPMPAATLGPGDVARVFVSTGNEGYRGASLDHPKSRPRILVVGDSLVMAENVPDGSTFVRQLGRALGERLGTGAKAIETINAGRSGYGPDQALLLLERDGPAVQPDLVVFVLCAHNDFGDLMRNKLFRLSSAGALEECRPFVGERMQTWFQQGNEESERLALQRLWSFRKSPAPVADEAPESAIELYLEGLRAQLLDHHVHRDAEVISLFEDIYDADIAIGLEEPTVIKRGLLTAIARRAARVCEQQLGGAELRFVVVPSAVDVCPSFDIRVDAQRYPAYLPSALSGTMAAAASDAVGPGRVMDLTATITEAPNPSSLFVGGTDIHWNAAGQRLCAASVAAWLTSDHALRQRLID